MTTTKLSNFEIKEMKDKNLNTYFQIINRDNPDEVYFCFESRVKEGWDILNKVPTPASIEIEYIENEVTKDTNDVRTYKHVTAVYPDDDIFV